MGYLDGSTITIDAILTQQGRRKLARGAGLGISKFSLSDDGVDYKLWNVNHPSGSSYYGEAINNLPNLEAITDDHVGMKYNLMTMDRNRVFLPTLNIVPNTITLERQGPEGAKTCTVNTYNFGVEQYSWLIYDKSAVQVNVATKDVGGSTFQHNVRQEIPNPHLVMGTAQLTFIAQPVQEDTTTIVQVYGLKSGATDFIKLTIKKNIRELPSS